MKQQLERRTTMETPSLEQRDDGGSPKIQGYAALYDVSTNIGGWFTESIKPGAFSRALKEGDDCRCLFNHSPDYVLGRTKSGTLKLREDSKGLWIENDMPDTQVGRDVMTSIKRGDVTGQSFAFMIQAQEWRFAKNKGELDHREITEVQLFDVGPVVYPAYETTSIAARSSEDAHKRAREEWEKAKQEHGDKLQKIITRATADGETVEVVVDSVAATVTDVQLVESDTAIDDGDTISFKVSVEIPVTVTTKEPADAGETEDVQMNSVDGHLLKIRCLRAAL